MLVLERNYIHSRSVKRWWEAAVLPGVSSEIPSQIAFLEYFQVASAIPKELLKKARDYRIDKVKFKSNAALFNLHSNKNLFIKTQM